MSTSPALPKQSTEPGVSPGPGTAPWAETCLAHLPALIAAHPLVVVEFWAASCIFTRLTLPCRRALAPLAGRPAGHAGHGPALTLLRCELPEPLDEAWALAAPFGVAGLPALVMYEHGERRQRWVGAVFEGLVQRSVAAALRRQAEQPVALVTGASRGLGRAMAIELAARRYHVLLSYRREHGEAAKTLEAIRAQGGSAALRPGDLTQDAQREALFRGLPRLDLLLNNAGITRDGLLMTMRSESWEQVISTNLGAAFHCSRLAARLMCRARRGVIVHIGSSSAASARVGQSNYSASKSGLIAMTRSMARELAGHGVRVLTVAPGFTASDMAGAVPGEVAMQSIARIPLGRWGRPEEIARTVAFLASDAAAAITGQTWMVDGGRTAFESEYGL